MTDGSLRGQSAHTRVNHNVKCVVKFEALCHQQPFSFLSDVFLFYWSKGVGGFHPVNQELAFMLHIRF